MSTYIRVALAIITGTVITGLLAYLGAVVFVVVRFGIPLGSTGREPTAGEYVALLAIVGGAGAIGAHIAAGAAREHRRWAVIVQALLLAAGALWGFTKPASHWPAWWAPAVAGVTVAGTWLGSAVWRPRGTSGSTGS